MDAKQRLKAAIAAHVATQIEVSWVGVGRLEDIPAIKEAAEDRAAELDALIDELIKE